MVAKRHDFRDKHQNSSSDPSRQSRLFSENASSASPYCPLINRGRTAVSDLGVGLILWRLKHLDIFVTLQSFWFWIIVSNVTSYPHVLVWIREAQTLMWVRAQSSGIGPVCNSCAIIKCLFSYEMILWLYWINSNRITSLSSGVLVSGWLVCSIGHNWTVEVGLNRS